MCLGHVGCNLGGLEFLLLVREAKLSWSEAGFLGCRENWVMTMHVLLSLWKRINLELLGNIYQIPSLCHKSPLQTF